MSCPLCGSPGYGYGISQYGGLAMGMQSLLGAQMQSMGRNNMCLSDEEYDLIMKLRDKERGIKKVQEIERQIWNPMLKEK